jgi:hypothetical protein
MIGRGNRNTRRKPSLVQLFPPQTRHSCPDANPGRSGGKLATNRLSYGMAYFSISLGSLLTFVKNCNNSNIFCVRDLNTELRRQNSQGHGYHLPVKMNLPTSRFTRCFRFVEYQMLPHVQKLVQCQVLSSVYTFKNVTRKNIWPAAFVSLVLTV